LITEMISLQDRTRSALQALVGKRLSLTKASGNLRAFHFGELSRKDGVVSAEYALHVSSPWRIEMCNQILTGSSDYYTRADDNDDPNWEYGMVSGTVQQQRLSVIFPEVDLATGVYMSGDRARMIVQAVATDPFGSASLIMSNEVNLVIFACSTKSEQWRLLPPPGDPHFVVEGGDAYVV
jgi:hypothetical protein